MAALGCVDAQADVGRVVPGFGDEGVAGRDAAECAAQAQVGLLERGLERRHGVAQREIGAVDGEHDDFYALAVEHREQGRRLAGGRGRGDGGRGPGAARASLGTETPTA